MTKQFLFLLIFCVGCAGIPAEQSKNIHELNENLQSLTSRYLRKADNDTKLVEEFPVSPSTIEVLAMIKQEKQSLERIRYLIKSINTWAQNND